MANEFKVKKGLLVQGSGSTGDETIVDIQGNSGQLFSITDNLIGSIFSANDISGLPLLDVNSNGTVIGGISTTLTEATASQGVSSVYDDLDDWDSNYVSGEIMKNQPIGESVAYGECLVLSDNFEWFKADQADVTLSSKMLGIALETASTGNIDILIKGFAETEQIEDSNAQTGLPMYLRESTSGDMSDTLPTSGVVRLVGYVYQNASTSSNGVFILRFDPDNTWVEL